MSSADKTRRPTLLLAALGLVPIALLLVLFIPSTAAQQAGGPAAALKAIGPDVILQLPWGSSGAALGRLDGNESASEGPMSFALEPGGEVVLLDQVNRRLVSFGSGGKLLGETPIPADTFQELELWPDGSVVLLDRLARRSLVVLGPAGQIIREEPIEGSEIPEGGAVTAMLAEPDGIWLEIGHESRVHVLDASLLPCPRTVLPARPLAAGAHLGGALDRSGGAELWLEDAQTGARPVRAPVQSSHRVARIIWLQADAQQRVNAFFHLMDLDPAPPYGVTHEEVLAVRYDLSLREVGRFRSSRVIQIWEQFREFRVTADGTAYQMAFDHTGVTILRWRWQ